MKKHVLTDCQCAFIFRRHYNKDDDTIEYVCEKEKLCIKLYSDCNIGKEICRMDKKALAALIPYCRKNCSAFYNYDNERPFW